MTDSQASSHPTNDLAPSEAVGPTDWQTTWWMVVAGHATALVLAFAILVAIWLFARPMALVFFGMVIAAALAPIMERLARFMPRALAVVIIFIVVVLLIITFSVLITTSVTAEAEVFQEQIPDSLQDIEGRMRDWGLISSDTSLRDQLGAMVSGLGTTIVNVPLVVFSGVIDLMLVFFVALYMLIEVPRIRDFVLSLVPPPRRDGFEDVAQEMLGAAGGYIRGVLMQSLIIGGISYIGFRLLGLEFPLFLAVIMGLGEVFPNIGPTVTGTFAVATSLLVSPTTALITGGFIIALQQVESNLVTPYVMHKQVHISPLMVLVALFAGGAVGGIIGVFVAIPLTAALRVFVVRVIAPAIREKSGAPSPDADPADGDTSDP